MQRMTPRQRRMKAKRDAHNATVRPLLGQAAAFDPVEAEKIARETMDEHDAQPAHIRAIEHKWS